jgi:hypothetical protein
MYSVRAVPAIFHRWQGAGLLSSERPANALAEQFLNLLKTGVQARLFLGLGSARACWTQEAHRASDQDVRLRHGLSRNLYRSSRRPIGKGGLRQIGEKSQRRPRPRWPAIPDPPPTSADLKSHQNRNRSGLGILRDNLHNGRDAAGLEQIADHVWNLEFLIPNRTHNWVDWPLNAA